MAAEANGVTGIQVPCPMCGEADANVSLYLWEGNQFHCEECDNEFSLEQITELINRWQPVLAWLAKMPRDKST